MIIDEPTNDTLYVDPNTDDLDAFTDLVSGKAQPKPAEEEKQEEKKPAESETPEPEEEEEIEGEEGEQEEDEGEEGDPDGEDKPKPEDKPAKKPNRFQERINELTAKAREAERRLAEIEKAKTAEPVAELPKPVQGPTPDDKNDDGSDKYPLGEFDPSYIRDLTRHTIQEESKAERQRSEQERAKQQEQEARSALQEQWVTKTSGFTEKTPDFVEKTMALEDTFEGLDPAYSDYLVNTVKSLDHGPEVLYHFANNIEEAQRFVKLGPLAATLALGELNAQFKTKPEASPKAEPKISKAPVPPQVNKGTKTRQTVAADTDDLDAFAELLFSTKKKR
jgi:chemotaxis protein histidine kinase CheA